MEWHSSHQVETPREGEEHCVTCGLWLHRRDDHKFLNRDGNYVEQPCLGARYWHKRYDGDPVVYFIAPGEIEPMPSKENLRRLRKFWNPNWCTCDSGMGIGYRLARHSYTGDFCVACDSEFITSKHHCHCPVCGGVNQVG